MTTENRLFWIVSVLAAVLIASPGCSRRNLEAVGEPGTPLVLMLSPSHGAASEHLVTLGSALGSATGLAIEVRVATSAPDAVSKAGTNLYDVGLLPLFDYLFCHQEFGVAAGLRVLRRDAASSYIGEILVREDSVVTSLGDLVGKKIAFVDPFSTSGFLLPAKRLRDAGIVPVPVFKGSHENALAALRGGEVEAAAVYAGAATTDTTLRVIVRTEEVPNEPIFFRRSLDPNKKKLVIDALLGFAGTPDGAQVLQHFADITGFVAVDDSTYVEAAALIRAAGAGLEDMVPEGWQIANEARHPLDWTP